MPSPPSTLIGPDPLDVVVGLGSNLGDRHATLNQAARAVAALGELRALSTLYDTAPLGPAQPDFLNAALRLVTQLTPPELLAALLEIERAAGRERRERWGPRTLDLDVLWIHGRAVSSPELTVPHPELTKRAFALGPLIDVAPDAVDPTTGAAYANIFARLDTTEMRRASPDRFDSSLLAAVGRR